MNTKLDKPKRSYYLPRKLAEAFDKECRKQGLVREKVVAASMVRFLNSESGPRKDMFEDLDLFVNGKK